MHNLEIDGSNPSPAKIILIEIDIFIKRVPVFSEKYKGGLKDWHCQASSERGLHKFWLSSSAVERGLHHVVFNGWIAQW